MEGYLLKWTNYIFGWQRRYFILYNGIIHYCKEKGSAQRGAIHLDVSETKKHPSNPKRFVISSGCTFIHLKAYTKAEADEWCSAIQQSQFDMSYSNTPMDPSTLSSVILDKVSAMWGIHSQLISAIEIIPPNSIKNNKNLENIVHLLEEMKKLSANALGVIEYQHENALRGSLNANRFSFGEAPLEDEFEDAVGQDESNIERKSLPVLRVPKLKKPLLSIIQSNPDTDYSSIKVPITYHEPLSLLQRLSEGLEYSDLLAEADKTSDPYKKLALIASFVCSAYLLPHRTTKPFNPYIGETFELQTNNFRMVSEQISANTSALYCEHNNYIYWNSTEIMTQFISNTLEINTIGPCHLKLINSNERYTWSRPTTSVSDLSSPRPVVQNDGEIRITTLASQNIAVITFNKSTISGKVFNELKQEIWNINVGKSIEISNSSEKITLIEKNRYPEGYEYNYYFKLFTMQLNLPPELYPELIMSDSRHRKDIRLLENGDIFQSAHYYEELLSRNRVESDHTPKWFKENSLYQWEYTGNYWSSSSS